jgi:hypothetical protein
LKILKIYLFILCLTLPLFATEKVKVFALHSYSQEYAWTKNQHVGFVSALNKTNKKFEFYTEYLDTKRVKLTPEYEKNFFEYLKNRYKDTNPDLIYVTDDNALEFILRNYKELFDDAQNIPVFFSGINNLQMQTILPSEHFAGVYETKEIKPNIELVKQFSPQTRDIYFLGDNSSTYLSIQKEILLQQENFKTLNFHFISDEHISNIKTMLPNAERSFIILTTIGNFKDDNNKTLLVEESIEKIKENKNVIILSMEDAYMIQGVVGGYVTSGSKQGQKVASLVLQYLNQKSLLNIESVLKSPNVYMFNSKELVNSRIILSEYIARNATFVAQNETFIEKNRALLLNILTIALIFSIFGAIVIFALQGKRYSKQVKKLQELKNTVATLNLQEQFIDNLLSFNDVGYWKLNLKTNELFVSKELYNILEIKDNIYKDDSNLLTYFIHLDDKQLFKEKLNLAKESKSSVKFNHRVVTSNNIVLKATHFIYTQYLNDEASLLIGIIKFEK